MSSLGLAALALFAAQQAAPESTDAPPKQTASAPRVAATRPLRPESPADAVKRLPGDLRAGVEWLVRAQNPDGSWGSHESPRPIEVLCNVPGSHEAFRVATSALCVMALRDASPGIGADVQGREAAIQRGLGFLLEHFAVKRASGLEHYNVWSFGYALQCFGEVLSDRPEDPRAAEMRAASKRLIEKLAQYQSLDGGWGYLSLGPVPTFQPSETSMSFTTATIVVGMNRAKLSGVPLPEKVVQRAIAEIERSRLPDGAFLYGDYLQYRPRLSINQVKGSACRSPACLYALDVFGRDVDDADFVKALEDLLVKHAGFQRAGVRRPIPHESWYAISGYFYLYGHAYAAYVLEKLAAEQQRRFWPLLVQAVQYCREPDGAFWDYPLYSYHKPYGTAYAVIAMARAHRFLAAQKG